MSSTGIDRAGVVCNMALPVWFGGFKGSGDVNREGKRLSDEGFRSEEERGFAKRSDVTSEAFWGSRGGRRSTLRRACTVIWSGFEAFKT